MKGSLLVLIATFQLLPSLPAQEGHSADCHRIAQHEILPQVFAPAALRENLGIRAVGEEVNWCLPIVNRSPHPIRIEYELEDCGCAGSREGRFLAIPSGESRCLGRTLIVPLGLQEMELRLSVWRNGEPLGRMERGFQVRGRLPYQVFHGVEGAGEGGALVIVVYADSARAAERLVCAPLASGIEVQRRIDADVVEFRLPACGLARQADASRVPIWPEIELRANGILIETIATAFLAHGSSRELWSMQSHIVHEWRAVVSERPAQVETLRWLGSADVTPIGDLQILPVAKPSSATGKDGSWEIRQRLLETVRGVAPRRIRGLLCLRGEGSLDEARNATLYGVELHSPGLR